MAAGQGRRWILTGPGAVSSHAAKGQPPASQRSGEPVVAASRRAGAVGPAREPALLAHRGPAAAVRAWLDGRCNASRGPRALEGEMHGSPPHPAGTERDEPVPGMISGGAPSPRRRRRRCMIRPWRPTEPGHLAGRRRGWLHSGRWPSPAGGPWPAIRPPVLCHLAPGPRPGQTGPASVADQQAAHVMAVAAAPPRHRGQPRSAKPEPPATSRQLARDNPADRWPRLAAGPPRDAQSPAHSPAAAHNTRAGRWDSRREHTVAPYTARRHRAAAPAAHADRIMMDSGPDPAGGHPRRSRSCRCRSGTRPAQVGPGWKR